MRFAGWKDPPCTSPGPVVHWPVPPRLLSITLPTMALWGSSGIRGLLGLKEALARSPKLAPGTGLG